MALPCWKRPSVPEWPLFPAATLVRTRPNVVGWSRAVTLQAHSWHTKIAANERIAGQKSSASCASGNVRAGIENVFDPIPLRNGTSPHPEVERTHPARISRAVFAE
jgi:hypothetical protein